MFPNNCYMTRQVSEEVPFSLQQLMWRLIFELGKFTELDYLQVFSFQAFNPQNETLTLIHTQEEPEFYAEHLIKVPTAVGRRLENRKIYIIDDIEYATMLFATEY
ncbi:MAG: DUF960 family protein [Bacilli bacterium]|jgi:hypothetical protein|nr:DUF960 family protein [Bacilli bacterium]HHU23837.1 DUF960 domain-containing protein [Acholeplasmataceae bacterium]